MSRLVFVGNRGVYHSDCGRFSVRQLVQAWWVLSLDGAELPGRHRTLKAATTAAVQYQRAHPDQFKDGDQSPLFG